jgi:hypothetical protein
MLARKIAIASTLLLVMLGAAGQQTQQSVILPSAEAKNLKFFGLPGKLTGHWNPKNSDIDDLERNLDQVTALDSKTLGPRFHIEHPEKYYRQYLGVALDYRRMIFVDAFCDLKGFDYWQEHLVIVSDGATCFWHALYDPASGKFTYLQINGRA